MAAAEARRIGETPVISHWLLRSALARIPALEDGRTARPAPARQTRMNPASLGISAIAVHQPAWELDNAWFGAAMPRKFSHHTGIEARAISLDDEVTMGVAAVRKLQRETGCNLADCRGIVFVSPSFIPAAVARRHLDDVAADRERPGRAARQVVRELGLTRCRSIGINWFCCGYSRALSLAARRWAPRLGLRRDEFVLVVVATRISRITDYSNVQTAGLFGDMASATLLATPASRRHPVHFEIVHADAEKQPVPKPAFDFHVREHVPVPAPDGGTAHDDARLVYALDGMAIAEIAPRAMSAAVAKALAESGLAPGDVTFVVPHQAGTGIVRFAGMKLDELGVQGEIVNGLTRRTGNVSACSVPHALRETWSRLSGVIACPTAAVGSPGRPEALQGCVLLRSTPHHDRQSTVAA
jgi:3-oxoacyl-[acyl-carrier-protein] synthase III